MEKYKEELFKEFLMTQKIELTNKNKEALFKEWLEEKKYILTLYEDFLESMDLIPGRGIVELEKSNYDSILPYTPIDTLGIAVSNNFINKKEEKKRIVGINGEVLINRDKDIVLHYNNKTRVLDFINFYITQFPCSNETIDLLVNILLTGRYVFIGTYGKLSDKDYEIKLKKLYELKKEIEKYTGKDIYGEVVKTTNYYAAAITPKLKYKKKEK